MPPLAFARVLGLLLSAASAWANGEPACPVRLLDIHQEKGSGDGEYEMLHLNEEGLQYLANQAAPLYMVPVLGVYRGGKSLLLNRLMGLQAPYSGGFGVGHEQKTFTRGINICAQKHEGLGTVVWMDTEGLFSSEDARSSHGPKIFSLALLFSSGVLLNNVKVLNEQFFAFFGEQQQVARVLKQGLASSGLPVESLLPANLSILWVLQQPIRYDASGETTASQLDSFLALPGDESRAHVKRDFEHLVQEVPVASYDSRQWGRLDQLLEEDLSQDYLRATGSLRELLLGQLKRSRPLLQPAGVAAHLKLYVDLVQTERFSGTLAREAFEESEIGTLCDRFGRSAAALAGSLPSRELHQAIEEARKELETPRSAAVEAYHLGSDWSRRLERCLQGKREDLWKRNADAVLVEWKAEAGKVAEEGSCFFLGKLTVLLGEYAATHGQAFSSTVQAQAVDFAAALQRARLVECVRLRDFLLPLAPWLIWPICGFYLRDAGIFSGLVSLSLHMVVLAGLYAVLQFLHQLPPYLDIDYPLLRAHPALLTLAMRAPPMVPWATIAKVVASAGTARSIWKLSWCLLHCLRRPLPGQEHVVGQMVNMELKLNALLKRSEALFRQELASQALEAAEKVECGEVRAAARSLLKLLCLVREVSEDWTSGVSVDAQCRKKASKLLQQFRLPPSKPVKAGLPCLAQARKLEELVGQGKWDELMEHAVQLLETLTVEYVGQPIKLAASPLRPASTLRQSPASTLKQSPVSTLKSSPGSELELFTPMKGEGDTPMKEGEDEAEATEEEATEDEEDEGEEEEDGAEEEEEEEGEEDEELDLERTGYEKLQKVAATIIGCASAAGMLAVAYFLDLLPAPQG